MLNDGQFVDTDTQTSYTQNGSNNKLIAELNPFKYRGYYYDNETGLYYLNSRYYDPNTCRFINADDISMLEVTQNSLNGLNLYAYCLNNPVNDTDSNGDLSWWQKLLIGVAFIVVGAVVTAVTAGTGTGFWAAFGSALLTSTIQTGISTGISAAIGFVSGGVSSSINGGSFWDGAFNGLVNGLVDGFMWGGIFAGGAQIIGGLIPRTSSFKIGQHEFMYGTDKSKTLLSINNKLGSSRFRIDIGKGSKSTNIFRGIHFHFGSTSKLRQLHRFFTPAIFNGIFVGLFRLFIK